MRSEWALLSALHVPRTSSVVNEKVLIFPKSRKCTNTIDLDSCELSLGVPWQDLGP